MLHLYISLISLIHQKAYIHHKSTCRVKILKIILSVMLKFITRETERKNFDEYFLYISFFLHIYTVHLKAERKKYERKSFPFT